jgi:hypothetical protein
MGRNVTSSVPNALGLRLDGGKQERYSCPPLSTPSDGRGHHMRGECFMEDNKGGLNQEDP